MHQQDESQKHNVVQKRQVTDEYIRVHLVEVANQMKQRIFFSGRYTYVVI